MTYFNEFGQARLGWNVGTPSGGGGSTPLLLDTYSGAGAAYSLRKLRTAYNGYAVRVRRASDNTSQDIGFNASGQLDTTALTSFVGTTAADSGYISIWYDQSGGTNDIINTTAAQQPIIILNGVHITQFGKPAVRFNGSSTVLTKSTLDFTANGLTSMGIITVFNTIADNSTNPRGLMYIGPDSGWGTIAKCASIAKIGWRFGTGQSSNTMTYNLSPNINNSITSLYHNNNTEILRMNGVDKITYTNKLATIANTGQILSIGHNYVYGGLLYHSGTISEMIIFKTNQIDNRAAIETAINANYSVY